LVTALNLKADKGDSARIDSTLHEESPQVDSVGRSIFASRLSFAFAVIAAMTVIVAAGLTYGAWTIQFNRYVRRNLQATADNIASSVAVTYDAFGGWSYTQFFRIPQVGTRADISVQIFDRDNNMVYDEKTFRIYHQLGGLEALPEGARPIPLNPANRDVIVSQIVVDRYLVGEVRVFANNSDGFLTRQDLEMRNSSLLALGAGGFIAIIAATFIGSFYARSLVRPIIRVTETAQRLREGDEAARCELVGDDEIAQLGITLDRMADSIQRDRSRERRLTGDVAHELRTPLMGIQATVEAIEDGIYPADSDHLSIISRETRRLSGLTTRILELSRLENTTEEFDLTLLDLNIPVSASISVNAALVESLDQELTVNQEPDLYIEGDDARLQQAIGNILVNAARYTSEGGRITVRTYSDGAYACVSISDTGIGISAKDMEHIFGRFWRADTARSRSSGGAGVGLTITKEIVDRHHGEVEIDSELGVGTTFTLKLPLAKS